VLLLGALAALTAAPVYALMAFGVVLAVMGHIFRDQRIVGIGIAILFIGTLLLIIGAYQSYQDQGPLDF
jgi:threonine/homoserine efflux transporter RhtA